MKLLYFGEGLKHKPENFTGISLTIREQEYYFWACSISAAERYQRTYENYMRRSYVYFPAEYRKDICKSVCIVYSEGKQLFELEVSNNYLMKREKHKSEYCFFLIQILDALNYYKNAEILYSTKTQTLIRFYNENRAKERLVYMHWKEPDDITGWIEGYYFDNILLISTDAALRKITSDKIELVPNRNLIIPKRKMKEVIIKQNLKSKGVIPYVNVNVQKSDKTS